MNGRRATVRPQVYIGHATTAITDAEKTYRTFTTRQPLFDSSSSSAQAWVSLVMDLDEPSEFDETVEINDITTLAEYTGLTSPQMRLVKMQEIISQNEAMPFMQRIFNAVHQATVSVDTTGTGDAGWGNPLTSVAVAAVSNSELLLVYTEGQCAFLLRGTQIQRLTPEPSDMMLRSAFDVGPEPIQVATWALQSGDIVLLGTGALSEAFSEADIQQIIQNNKLQNAANVLVIEAASRYSRSEISAVLLQWNDTAAKRRRGVRPRGHRQDSHRRGSHRQGHRLRGQIRGLIGSSKRAGNKRRPVWGLAAVLTLALLVFATWFVVSGMFGSVDVNALSLRELLARVGVTAADTNGTNPNETIIGVGENSAIAAATTVPTLAPIPGPRTTAVDATDETKEVSTAMRSVILAETVTPSPANQARASVGTSQTLSSSIKNTDEISESLTITVMANPMATPMATAEASISATLTTTLRATSTLTSTSWPISTQVPKQTTTQTVPQAQRITPVVPITSTATTLGSTIVQKLPTVAYVPTLSPITTVSTTISTSTPVTAPVSATIPVAGQDTSALAPPAAKPTIARPTSTITPTSTATPTPSATASPRPTAIPLPTYTPTVAINRFVQLQSPSDGNSGGRSEIFSWTANFIPDAGQAFELIFWLPDRDPMTDGFGLAVPTTNTSVRVELDILDRVLGTLFVPNRYKWGVLLVQTDPYRRIQYLGGGWFFHFDRHSGSSSRASYSGE